MWESEGKKEWKKIDIKAERECENTTVWMKLCKYMCQRYTQQLAINITSTTLGIKIKSLNKKLIWQ